MINIKDKDLKQAVEKAVLLLGPNPTASNLIDSLRNQLNELFNKNDIEVLIEKHEQKYSTGPTQTMEQRVASLEQMVYNLNKRLSS